MKKGSIAVVSSLLLCLVTIGNAQSQSLSAFPKFPWETWGEMSYAPGHDVISEHGTKLDGYVQQGIDWYRFNLGKTGLNLNTFLGLRYSVSQNSNEWWNNKVGLWGGVQLVDRDLSPTSNGWGNASFGIRGEVYDYFRDGHRNEARIVGFVKWTFGGDWKK